MCYNKFCFCFLVVLIVINLVKGSCLEYGHSCWGAHGKRSSPTNGNKIHSANPLLRVMDNNVISDDPSPYFENFDDLTVKVDNPDTDASSEENESRHRKRVKQLAFNKDQLKHPKSSWESWKKLPIYNIQPNFANSLLKNEILQQLEQKAIADKDNSFYD